MKPETAPVSDGEWLLRRVWHERYRTNQNPIISPNAFEPRLRGEDRDTDGISLYRLDCQADPTDVLATVTADRRHLYAVVRVQVSTIKALGMSVCPAPDDHVKGHVVIPELNADDYAANKARFTPIKLSLATEASRDENVLVRPSQETS